MNMSEMFFCVLVVLFMVLLAITSMPLWLLRKTYITHQKQMTSNHQDTTSLKYSYTIMSIFSGFFTSVGVLSLLFASYDMCTRKSLLTAILLEVMIPVLYVNLLFFMLPLYIWFRYSVNENQTSNIQHTSTTTI